ncbi:hypothetical protein [uncultured Thiodictyon sp.]|uniref:hypothetical protein n=1 Tax=uncultured Thiodictyon sp. TaxID=1846217 RepID=UPI0025E9CBC1|nr:hypothetical protein [uncultured Thiodictyon sp.]
MKTSPLTKDVSSQPHYLDKTPAHYLASLAPEMRSSFTAPQLEAMTQLLAAAIPESTPKLLNLKFSVDLLISRFYVVLLVGKDRRRQGLRSLPEPLVRIANLIAAMIVLAVLNLLISIVIFLFAYLVKSALGIDFFTSLHLVDVWNIIRKLFSW